MKLSVSVLVGFLALMASAGPAATSDEPNWRVVMSSFGSGPSLSFIHLGDDGVLRQWSSEGEVLQYAPLSQNQITVMRNEVAPRKTAEENRHLAEVYEGVDGRNVTDENDLLHPGEGVYPVHLFDAIKKSKQEAAPTSDSTDESKLVERQACRSAACQPGVTDCSRYYCASCVVMDMYMEGECQGNVN